MLGDHLKGFFCFEDELARDQIVGNTGISSRQTSTLGGSDSRHDFVKVLDFGLVKEERHFRRHVGRRAERHLDQESSPATFRRLY
jgi:hypothetical protein